MDNSSVLLLRLLDLLQVKEIFIAGLDGYNYVSNYLNGNLESNFSSKNAMFINREVEGMLKDYLVSRKNKTPISFLTHSRFEHIFEDGKNE